MSNSIDNNVADIETYLRRIDYTIRKKGREIIAEADITIPQFHALQILRQHERMTIGELSQKMALACSTITDLVDRMEKTGLVERRKNKLDKRVILVGLLPKGYEILERVLKKRREYLKGKMSDYDIESMEILKDGLEDLYKAIEIEE